MGAQVQKRSTMFSHSMNVCAICTNFFHRWPVLAHFEPEKARQWLYNESIRKRVQFGLVQLRRAARMTRFLLASLDVTCRTR